MTTIKELSITANNIFSTPDYNANSLSTLIRTVDALARLTYQSMYLTDLYRQEFPYVSNNSQFLCGITAEEMKAQGYNFYLQHIPEDELKMIIELNTSCLELLNSFDEHDKYLCTVSCHFHLKSGTKTKLVNQQFTPILLTDEGKIWIGICTISLSSYQTAGHAEFHKQGQKKYWEYSFQTHQWEEHDGFFLKDAEVEVLRLSAAGFTMAEIAERMYRSIDSIKTYKRHTFEKLGVKNISEAICRAELEKLF